MIAIVDYGMGNLRSVVNALHRLNAQAVITQDPETIRNASHLILPGVGAFPDGMNSLSEFGLIGPLLDRIRAGTPLLAICLGMQLLFSESEEFGRHRGLDLIPGKVVRFPDLGLKIPHMGWNRIAIRKRTPLFEGIPDGAHVYFVHSYYPVPEDPEVVASTTRYGVEFASSLASGRIFACQFHPEKSQQTGLKILENFTRFKP